MRKVVINKCFGGFGLSHEAMLRYAKLKGCLVYGYTDQEYKALGLCTYYIDPKDPTAVKGRRQALSTYDIERDDPMLVRVVEEMGSEKASGQRAELKVVEIPDGVAWSIKEYDGNEHVAESHRTWS